MLEFTSRKPVTLCLNGCVASSQQLASQIGLDILKVGGNAADAAVAVAAALNVTEPCSTGIGGDAFCLFYDAKEQAVKGINGSGRCSSRVTLSGLAEQGFTRTSKFPPRHGHAVTVPGAAAAWVDTVNTFGSGKLTMHEVLRPAIELAQNGFPVQELTAWYWKVSEELLQNPRNRYGTDMLLEGRAPRHGEIMRLPKLADTFKELASQGKEGFYQGRIAAAVSAAVQEHGGILTPEDLACHTSTKDQPIYTDYRGCRVWEMPPNGQGLTALIALNILEGFDLQGMQHNSSQYIHLLVEALRLSFADTTWYTSDPSAVEVPVRHLLSKEYATRRRCLIDPLRANLDMQKGGPFLGSDTVYFCVADRQGNACSFINSNFMGFGTAIVPQGCGFTLQNRGFGFSLDPDHPNSIAAGKRPYHTIIPSLVTDAQTGELLSVFGVMGGYMQPQGHVQVLLNQVEFGMNPQQALDQPRFCLGDNYGSDMSCLTLEEGLKPEVTQELLDMGHQVKGVCQGPQRSMMGRGQVITRGAWWDRSSAGGSGGALCDDRTVYWAGSDPRADGIVAAY